MSQTTPFIEYANIGDAKVVAKYDLESYQQGAKEFAEWLQEYVIIDIEFCTTLVGEKEYTRLLSFIELLDMWQKGAEE